MTISVDRSGASSAGGTAGSSMRSISADSGIARTPSIGFRSVALGCTYLSGTVALVFQIAWQKYLSFLLGSEAKSSALVVAVFLFGLASGYQFWGRFTQRGWSRRRLLAVLGMIELGIAAYALAFGTWFSIVKGLCYGSPDHLSMDLLFAAALLFLPTFLMGGSIPLLTAALPETADEVAYCHSRIYGINTLGAFLGAFIGGFWLVPALGLSETLLLGAVVQIVIGLVFLFNRLSGGAHLAGEIPRIDNSFGTSGVYIYTFVTGAVAIGCEVLFMRLVSLTMGSGYFVFPIVVGLVILGLALGSLSLKRTGITSAVVLRELVKLAIVLAVVSLTVPFWGYWLSMVRVSLATIPTNYPVYMFLAVVFFGAMLLPVIIPMGRLLPIGYALLDKNREDYGRVCGMLYFCNTLGTAAGAVLIGYLLLMVMDLQRLMHLNVALLLGLAAFLSLRSGKRPMAGALAVFAAAVFLLPGWNRQLHMGGLFREVRPSDEWHFNGPFAIPEIIKPADMHMLHDDPMMTVGVFSSYSVRRGTDMRLPSRTITVNGKSDGNTIGDYSNMVLSGVIPYLFSSKPAGIEAAVVGLGTGMTSGALAGAGDVSSVTTLEISPSVIRAAPLFDEGNFGLSLQPKSRLVQTDAFRYFSRGAHTFDIIVSEPSNPWVNGVENLFTPEFYGLVSASLREGGVFFQWLQLYEINDAGLAAVAENITSVFPHASIFLIGSSDIGILASASPLEPVHMQRRMQEAFVQHALKPMVLDDPAIFTLMETLQTAQLRVYARTSTRPAHRVEFPWLSAAADRSRFLKENANLTDDLLSDISRHLEYPARRIEDFDRWMKQHAETLDPWCDPVHPNHSTRFLCEIFVPLSDAYRKLTKQGDLADAGDMLRAYRNLRTFGYIRQNTDLLARVRQALLERGAEIERGSRVDAIAMLAEEYALERLHDSAEAVAHEFHEKQLLPDKEFQALLQEVRSIRERVAYLAAELGEKF